MADEQPYFPDASRYQPVTQYYNPVQQAPQLSMRDQYRNVTDPRFQYGVSGGQDRRYYARQLELNRAATAASMGSFAGETASFAVASIGGPLGFALTAPLIPMHFLAEGFNYNLQRQKLMQSNAMDLDTYRSRLGFTGGLSYNQSTALGASLAGNMMEPNQFFSSGQQSTINKIGLSNDLISARGVGTMSGTSGQYMKNFKELKETAELMVKTLKTTIEGGMSVMNELKGAGFNSFAKMKQQIQQSAATGSITGLGTTNTLQLGFAGAQAVQGTPWTAASGASMFQAGASQAAAVAMGTVSGARAIERAGGVAQAGAAIANAQMNILMNSTIGTRMAAYAMNANGTTNAGRMDALLHGKVSAFDIVNGSADRGYAMGTHRVRFGFMKEDFYNSLNDNTRAQLTMEAFNKWGSQRGGDTKDQAAVFAGMNTSNDRDKRALYEWLLAPKGFVQQEAAERAQGMMSSMSMMRPITLASELYKTAAVRGMTQWGRDTAASFSGGMDIITGETASFNRGITQWGMNRIEDLAKVTGVAKYGVFDRSLLGDVEQGVGRIMGTVDYGNSDDFSNASKGRRSAAERLYKRGPAMVVRAGTVNSMTGGVTLNQNSAEFDVGTIFQNNSMKDINDAADQLGGLLGNGNIASAINSPLINQTFLRDKGVKAQFKRDPAAVIEAILAKAKKFNTSARAEWTKEAQEGNAYLAGLTQTNPHQAARYREELAEATRLENDDRNYKNNIVHRTTLQRQDIEERENALDPRARKTAHANVSLGDTAFHGNNVANAVDAATVYARTTAGIHNELTAYGSYSINKYGASGQFRGVKNIAQESYLAAKSAGVTLGRPGSDITFAQKVSEMRTSMETNNYIPTAAERPLYEYVRDNPVVAKNLSEASKDRATALATIDRQKKIVTLQESLANASRTLSPEAIAIQNERAAGHISSEDALTGIKALKTGAADLESVGFVSGHTIKTAEDLETGTFGTKAVRDQDRTVAQQLGATSATMKTLLAERDKIEDTLKANPASSDAKTKLDQNIKDLDAANKKLEAIKAVNGTEETAAGRSIATAMSPPVLNYWNNRWVL